MKIETFSSTMKKTSAKSPGEKIITVSADRDLFGRLLVVAKTREINLREVLSYELSIVPVVLADPDGSLRKTTKSTRISVLEKKVDVLPSLPSAPIPTAYVIDGMAMIQAIRSGGSATFGGMVEKYCEFIMRTFSQNNCTRLDLVFDQYFPRSIKDGERQRRGQSSSLEIKIQILYR